MTYLKYSVSLVLLLTVAEYTKAQTKCEDGRISVQGSLNGISFFCCIPQRLQGRARCVQVGKYVTDAPTTVSPTSPSILITKPKLTMVFNSTTTPVPTQTPSTTPTTPTTTPTTTPITEPTTEPNTTPTPTTTEDDYETSGDTAESQESENSAITGLSIGIPLVVVSLVIVSVLLLRLRYKRKKTSDGVLPRTVDVEANGNVYKRAEEDSAADGVYREVEHQASASAVPPTYDSLHLYGNAPGTDRAYEQLNAGVVQDYEQLHMYSNTRTGETNNSNYDTVPSQPQPMYANVKQYQT